MAPLTFSKTATADRLLIELSGELDLRGATIFDPEIERLAAEPGAGVVVLDLRGLDFLDSSGLRSVVMADAALRRAGRKLVLIRGGAAVQRVFAVTRMEERLHFVDDESGLDGAGDP